MNPNVVHVWPSKWTQMLFMSGQANGPKCCSRLERFRRPLTAKTQVCTHRCPEGFLVDNVALDRASLLGIRLSPVSCHPSNAQKFIVVFHQCLEVNSGALLEIRPRHSHPPYVQVTAYVYSHPAIVHYIHLPRCLPYNRSRSSTECDLLLPISISSILSFP
jgi:hypothetical protein